MAINQNHLFEDIDGAKCAVVEKNVSQTRLDFLRPLLEFNGYTVKFAVSPPPKTPAPADGTAVESPDTFTLGVTDVGFNATNAVFGRLLKTADGHVVTLAYWHQKEKVSSDDTPYFENKAS